MISPCVGICKVQNSVCAGCRRTLEEIGSWSVYSDQERERIMSRVLLELFEQGEQNVCSVLETELPVLRSSEGSP